MDQKSRLDADADRLFDPTGAVGFNLHRSANASACRIAVPPISHTRSARDKLSIIVKPASSRLIVNVETRDLCLGMVTVVQRVAMADGGSFALGLMREAHHPLRPQVGSPMQEGITAPAPRSELLLPEGSPDDPLAAFVAKIRRGDERALEQLYDATVAKLYALASGVLRNAEDAEEIVCSTYAYAWANAGRFDPQRANVLGWLLMLCRSRALDRLRQRDNALVTVDSAALENAVADQHEQPEDMLALFQQHSRVRAALERLTPQRRHLLSLSFLQGLSHQEIADLTGMPLGTVKSHSRRALDQLRTELETP